MGKFQVLKFLLMLFLVVMPSSEAICGINLHTVHTNINDEIEISLREKLQGIKNELLLSIRNKDYKKFESLMSPKLKALNGFNAKSFVDQLTPVMKNDFELIDQYHSVLSKKFGDDFFVTILPAVADKDSLTISQVKFYGDESYNLFLKSTNTGWQYLFFVSLGRYGNDWKVNMLHLGNYSINNLTVNTIYEKGKKALGQGRLTSSCIYSWALERLLRPAPYLRYAHEEEIVEFVEKSFKEFNEDITFPFIIDGKEFVDMQVETTNNEGLIPVLHYITEEDLDEQKVKKEAMQLKKQIISKFHGIEVDFDYLLLRAFNEAPVDPNITYQNYGVVMRLKE